MQYHINFSMPASGTSKSGPSGSEVNLNSDLGDEQRKSRLQNVATFDPVNLITNDPMMTRVPDYTSQYLAARAKLDSLEDLYWHWVEQKNEVEQGANYTMNPWFWTCKQHISDCRVLMKDTRQEMQKWDFLRFSTMIMKNRRERQLTAIADTPPEERYGKVGHRL